MRDRDLMHVDVTSDGAWERATDADWRDMLEREREWEWEVEQGQREGYLVADSDADLLRLVPWRGFSWEEAEGGTGLPPGFRGRDGGMLLEERLKELALRVGGVDLGGGRLALQLIDSPLLPDRLTVFASTQDAAILPPRPGVAHRVDAAAGQ
jgi:GNAT superfamily N-acetyltransferase